MTTRLTTLTINELGAATAAAANAAAAASSAASAAEYGTKPSRLIDGDFNFWPEGAGAFTSNGYTAAMWRQIFSGGTVSTSRQSHTLGTAFGLAVPRYFHRTAVSGQSLASHYALVEQRIEDVRTFAGQTVTVLGWVRMSAGSGTLGLSIGQFFGTGGSPSAQVNTAGGTAAVSTGDWTPFAITLTVPSITGKTLGTANNDWIRFEFWFSDGGDFVARSGLPGVQSGNFDLACIHIRQGTHAVGTTANYLGPDPSVELPRTLRYFNKSYNLDTAPGATTNYVGAIYGEVEVTQSFAFLPHLRFPVPMRAAPTFTVYNPETGTAGEARNISGSANAAVSTLGGGETGFSLNINNVSVTAGNNVAYHYTADARL